MPAPLSRSARWTVPVAVAAVIAAGGVAVRTSAQADSGLPDKTAAELLVAVQNAGSAPFAGTVTKTARLGIPALPGNDTSLQSLVSGTHTARVWYAGPDRTRVALVGDLAETDVIHNGRDVWIWSSDTDTAQHATLPAHQAGDAGAHDRTAPTPEATALTPAEAATQALAAIDPTTAVTVSGTSRVAERPVYELVLRPKDPSSLIGQVRLAIDSATSTPLRVQVYATGGTKPAFETSFTSIEFATPSADLFAFTPPPGAKVKQLGGSTPEQDTKAEKATPDKAGATSGTTVVGKGWTSVLVLHGSPADAAATKGSGVSGTLATMLRATTPVSGTFGSGRLLRTKLVSVLLLDDGRTLIGAVTPAALEAAAADPAAK